MLVAISCQKPKNCSSTTKGKKAKTKQGGKDQPTPKQEVGPPVAGGAPCNRYWLSRGIILCDLRCICGNAIGHNWVSPLDSGSRGSEQESFS